MRLILALLVAVPAPPPSAGVTGGVPTLEHEPPQCILAGQPSLLRVRVTPFARAARAQVQFRGGPEEGWQTILMRSDLPSYVATLPRPRPGSTGLEYLIEVATPEAQTVKTPLARVRVVADAATCEGKVAATGPAPRATGRAGGSEPASGGGGHTRTLALVVGGGAAVAGGLVLAGGGGASPTSTTPVAGPTTPPVGGVPPPPTSAPAETTTPPATQEPRPTPTPTVNPDPGATPTPTPTPTPAPTPTPTPTPAPTTQTGSCTPGDTQRPTTAIFAPLRGTRLTSSPVLVQATAEDNFTVRKVEFYYHITASGDAGFRASAPAVLFATDTNAPYNANWSLPTACGEVTLQTIAYDGCDNLGGSVVIPMNVCYGTSSLAGSLVMSSAIDAAEVAGQMVLDGERAVAVRAAPTTVFLRSRPVHRVHAEVVKPGRPGLWRFDLSGAGVRPGSLRVEAGVPFLLTPDNVHFRISGQSGERIIFTYRAEE